MVVAEEMVAEVMVEKEVGEVVAMEEIVTTMMQDMRF